MNLLDLLHGLYIISIGVLAVALYNTLQTLRLIKEGLDSTKVGTHLRIVAELFWKKNITILVIAGIAIVVLIIRFGLTGDVARIAIGSLVLLFSLSFYRFSVLNKKLWLLRKKGL